VPAPLNRAGNETLTVLRFHKPIGVLHAILSRIAWFHACWELVKTQRPLGEIPPRIMSESNSQLKSLILAQNERWRQA
jgi:hypothetical protein